MPPLCEGIASQEEVPTMSDIKVFVIGIDAATFDLLDPWIDSGELPNIKSLLDSGCSGVLKSTVPPLSAVAWPSLCTGVNPGKHGIFDFLHESLDGTSIRFMNGSNCKAIPVWQYLNAAGYKTGLINIPMTYPPPKVEGFAISGLDTPPKAKEFTYPPELGSRLTSAVNYVVELDHSLEQSPCLENYVNHILDVVDKRDKAIQMMMSESCVDFFMAVFTESDRAQHFFWKYLDKDHPEYTSGYEDVILRVYRRIDEAIGKILDRLNESAAVIVVSDHGMKGLYKSIDINQWLHENGYFQMKDTNFSMLVNLLKKAKNRIAGKRKVEGFHNRVNWDRTKAYHLGSWGNIFINVKSRQPKGIVAPGIEYELLRDELIEQLSRLKDPSNGRSVVREVKKKEELFSGEYMSHAPDLVVVWNDHYNCVKTSHQIGKKQKSDKDVFQLGGVFSADHDSNGIFIIKSPLTLSGVRNMQADIVDIAATVLNIMGVAVPQSMDGRVLQEVFREPCRAGSAVCVDTDLVEARLSEEINYSEEDAEKVAERLRNLGYME